MKSKKQKRKEAVERLEQNLALSRLLAKEAFTMYEKNLNEMRVRSYEKQISITNDKRASLGEI